MKTYIIYAIKGFDCVVDGNSYHPIRAMVGIVETVGSVDKITGIKLIKCSKDFIADVGKKCNIFFDDNGKAVAVQYIKQ
jgi:hypothetical protein